MCLQCLTKAEIFASHIKDPSGHEVLPGYILTRATQDAYPGGENCPWSKGEYGLVRQNDPDLIFDCEILPEPDSYKYDDEMKEKENEKYFDELDRLAEAISEMHFNHSIKLLEAMNDVYGVAYRNAFESAELLMPILYNHVQKHSPKSTDEWECLIRGMTRKEWDNFCKEVEDRNRQANERIKHE